MKLEKPDYKAKTVLKRISEEDAKMTRVSWTKNGKPMHINIPSYKVPNRIRLLERDHCKNILTKEL